MPRKEIDYSKTVIYKIVCNDLTITDLYVGSTVNFISRKSQHKQACNKCEKYKVYQIINDNGGWENWSMVEIEKYPCNNGNEARTRERYWFEELHAKLNASYPIRSYKEYNDTNKENRKEYRKINKDIIAEKRKIYDEKNKDIKKEYKKRYYQENKERIKAKANKYYQDNTETVKANVKKYRAIK